MYPAPRQINGDDTVLMTLEHELRLTVRNIPELNGPIFRARNNPMTVR